MLLRVFILSMMLTTPVYAFDWKQPILDENNRLIIDWLSCPPTRQISATSPWGSDPKDKCEIKLTIGTLVSRALLSPSPQGSPEVSPDQKALAGHLGLEIMLHPDMTPNPDQLKMAKDAVGKITSPLAVARAWDLLDKAVK